MKVREYLRQPNVHWVNCFPNAKLGQECLVTAISDCYYTSSSLEYEDVLNKVRDFLKVSSLTDWNDDPSRTLQEILELVDTLDI